MVLSTRPWHFLLTSIRCGFLLGAATACFASSITYVGSDVDLGSGWRTSTVSKNDIDGNNVLGSDGWYVVGNSGSQMLPSYITSFVSNDSVYGGNGGYFSIDDPATTPGPSPSTIVTGTLNPGPGPGNTTTDLSFTFGADVPAIVRIGLMVDNLDIAAFNPAAVQVVQNGGSAASPVVDTTGASFNNRIPDWLYFDIQAQPGETYDVVVTGGPNGCACLGAASFDSVSNVPEPSSFQLFGIGAALLAIGALRGGRIARFIRGAE